MEGTPRTVNPTRELLESSCGPPKVDVMSRSYLHRGEVVPVNISILWCLVFSEDPPFWKVLKGNQKISTTTNDELFFAHDPCG